MTVGMAYKLAAQVHDFKEQARKGIYDPEGKRYLVQTGKVPLRDVFINCGSDIAGEQQIEVQFFPRFAELYVSSDDPTRCYVSSSIDNLETGHLLLTVRSLYTVYFLKKRH